jgi:hypothetical protein
MGKEDKGVGDQVNVGVIHRMSTTHADAAGFGEAVRAKKAGAAASDLAGLGGGDGLAGDVEGSAGSRPASRAARHTRSARLTVVTTRQPLPAFSVCETQRATSIARSMGTVSGQGTGVPKTRAAATTYNVASRSFGEDPASWAPMGENHLSGTWPERTPRSMQLMPLPSGRMPRHKTDGICSTP